eukprot:TRINITY_DN19789_c0_g1_i2.p1 TRINITY_DN19789_c0_g1~~TRINITY_DN19789_c0_g1_i2.p1  ORF type:complete len:210 (-),score=14.33 TRINITY_DN19789_c0_g1_i2:32-661(-)
MLTFKEMIAYTGGVWFHLFTFLILMIQKIVETGNKFWLAQWSDHPTLDTNSYYFTVYCIIGFLYPLILVIKVIICLLQHTKSAQNVHDKMINILLKAPISQFFERIPVGRIINRLSNDLGLYDIEFIMAVGATQSVIYNFITNLFVCLWGSRGTLIPLVIIYLLVIFYYARYYRRTFREIYRLESISKSPIVSMSVSYTHLTLPTIYSV